LWFTDYAKWLKEKYGNDKRFKIPSTNIPYFAVYLASFFD
jgi:hypothetical protein